MPGRHNPKPTEEERRREYRLMQKRSYGDHVSGPEAEWLDEMGAAGEVQRERDAWAQRREEER